MRDKSGHMQPEVQAYDCADYPGIHAKMGALCSTPSLSPGALAWLTQSKPLCEGNGHSQQKQHIVHIAQHLFSEIQSHRLQDELQQYTCEAMCKQIEFMQTDWVSAVIPVESRIPSKKRVSSKAALAPWPPTGVTA